MLFGYRDDAEVDALIHAGKRATWPKLAQVRNATLIASTLDGILEQLDGNRAGMSPGNGRRHLTAPA